MDGILSYFFMLGISCQAASNRLSGLKIMPAMYTAAIFSI